jgi:hypothetical protein
MRAINLLLESGSRVDPVIWARDLTQLPLGRIQTFFGYSIFHNGPWHIIMRITSLRSLTLSYLFVFQTHRVAYKCTWPGCNTTTKTRTGVEGHIRRIHLAWVSVFLGIVTMREGAGWSWTSPRDGANFTSVRCEESPVHRERWSLGRIRRNCKWRRTGPERVVPLVPYPTSMHKSLLLIWWWSQR